MHEPLWDDHFLEALRLVAPGTPLREGLDQILRAHTGALIVVGDGQEVAALIDGGFRVDRELQPASLYELSKMDGALVLSREGRRILHANVQLLPDRAIPSQETGIRHRTAERVARQTGALVIAISQRRNIVSLYRGEVKYVLHDIGFILTKANQAIQTLGRYRAGVDQALANLTALEFEDLVTLTDVTTTLHRTGMMLAIKNEIDKYIRELGTEGRLVGMQLEELAGDITEEAGLIARDYSVSGSTEALTGLSGASPLGDDLTELVELCRRLGYPGGLGALDQSAAPRGYRILRRIPRLPMPIIDNLVRAFGTLQRALSASTEELDGVEGIGEVRARTIHDGLRRLRDQAMLDRHL